MNVTITKLGRASKIPVTRLRNVKNIHDVLFNFATNYQKHFPQRTAQMRDFDSFLGELKSKPCDHPRDERLTEFDGQTLWQTCSVCGLNSKFAGEDIDESVEDYRG